MPAPNELPRACDYCGADKEIRPYGPRGERICFACAFATPERKRETEQAFSTQLAACGEFAVAGTEAGPVPFERKPS